jgi:hypothetical protein
MANDVQQGTLCRATLEAVAAIFDGRAAALRDVADGPSSRRPHWVSPSENHRLARDAENDAAMIRRLRRFARASAFAFACCAALPAGVPSQVR